MVGKFFCFVFLLLVLISLPVFSSGVSEQDFDNPIILASCSDSISCFGEWFTGIVSNVQNVVSGKPIVLPGRSSGSTVTEIIGPSSKPTVVISNSSSGTVNNSSSNQNNITNTNSSNTQNNVSNSSNILNSSSNNVSSISIPNTASVNNVVPVQDSSVAGKLANLRTELKRERKVLEGYRGFSGGISVSVLSVQELKVVELESKMNDLLVVSNVSVELESQLDEIDKKAITWEANYTSVSILDEVSKRKLLGAVMSEEEKQEIASNQKASNVVSASSSAIQTTPYYFNWMNYGGKSYVTSAKTQECGACWAFAAVGALEGTIQAYFNNPDLSLDLSEQDVISCSKSDGCSGGSDGEALEYVRVSGVVKESCFPNVGQDASTGAPCSNKCSTSEVWKLTSVNGYYVRSGSYSDINQFFEDIKKAILEKGPVSASMGVYEDFFSYSGGIYSHISGSFQGGHVVTLVGYGYSNGKLYWIGKNSWGPSWGENGGFFKIFADDISILDKGGLVQSIVDPISSVGTVKLCSDSDGDGFCNWGLGSKPNNCPGSCSGNVLEDCDDSSSGVHFNCGRQACLDMLGSGVEVCDGKDNDCDGWVDNNPGTDGLLSRTFYSGPSGTEGVGVCKAGTQTCSNASWGSITGEVLPSTESCNAKDDDCDGTVDEGSDLCPGGQVCSSGVCTTGLGKIVGQYSTGSTKGNCSLYGYAGDLADLGFSTPVWLCVTATPTDVGSQCVSLTANKNYTWDSAVGNHGFILDFTGLGVPDGMVLYGGMQLKSGAVQYLDPMSYTIVLPQEICGNGIDDDCDGQVDEGCTSDVGKIVGQYSNSSAKGNCSLYGYARDPSDPNYKSTVYVCVTPTPTDISSQCVTLTADIDYSSVDPNVGFHGFVFDFTGLGVSNGLTVYAGLLMKNGSAQYLSPNSYTIVLPQETANGKDDDCDGQIDEGVGTVKSPAPCVPSCVGKGCGSDGCGGTCGSCGANQTCSNNQCVNNAVTYIGYPKNEIMNLGGTYYHVNYAVAANSGEVWCNGSSMASVDGSVDCGGAYGYTCYRASNNLVGCVKPCQSNTCNCASLAGTDLVSLGIKFTDSGVYACGIGSQKRYVGSYNSSPECGFFYYWKEVEDCAASGKTCSNGNCA